MLSGRTAWGHRKLWAATSATLITIMASTSIWGLASASSTRPTISRFQTSPPQVASGGGDVAVTAAVAHATTCRLASTPPVPGLPVSIRCGGGSFRRVVRFPANLGADKPYRLVLTATSRGTSATAIRTLEQLPVIPLLSWGPTETADPDAGLVSVSCPTTTWCLAADDEGNTVQFNGSSWTTPAHVGAEWVSCPTTSFCAAANGQDVQTFDGTTWSAQLPVGPSGTDYLSVSCSTAARCVALGNDGEALYDGGTWSYARLGAASGIIDTLSCPTPSFCMAVGLDASSVAYNGSKWSDAGLVVPPAGDTGVRGAVSCAPTRWCMYVGNGSGINTTSELGYADAYSGRRWTGPVVIEPAGRPSVNGVSCRPDGYCVAVDANGDARTHYRGGWSRLVAIDPKAVDPGLTAVSCASMTFCVAVGSSGEAVVGQ